MITSKDLNSGTWVLNISNLLNERYERLITYNQEARQLRIGFTKKY